MTRFRTVIAVVMSCAVLALGQEAKGPKRAEPSPSVTAGEVLEWTDAAGKPYWYRVPKSYAPGRPLTLTLMLHGTGLKWGWAFWNYPIADGKFRGDDLVVAPEAMTAAQGGVFNFIQGKTDGDHLADLIAAFRKKFQIQRVYIYGHSQGAFFSYWFAGEHPELVDGIVAHAGNVLADVKHTPLAKEKVAIGILHGRADAVVPVDCAFATERTYRGLGYKKVKVRIVEGLTEQSGHWPLPVQAAEMLAWLDAVGSETPSAALGSALSALGRGEPDIAITVDATLKAAKLIKAATKLDNREALAKQQAELSAWLDDLAKSAAADILNRPDSRKSELTHGAMLVRFRVMNRGLDLWPAWAASMRDLRTKAGVHDKIVQGGIDRMLKSGLHDGAELTKAVQDGFLASQYETFVTQLERALAAPQKNSKPEDVAKLKALIEGRRAAELEGRDTATKLMIAHIAPLRAAHPDWFPQAE